MSPHTGCEPVRTLGCPNNEFGVFPERNSGWADGPMTVSVFRAVNDVSSTRVRGYRYVPRDIRDTSDAGLGTLYVRFIAGDAEWVFEDVPHGVYSAFTTCGVSKGRFVDACLRAYSNRPARPEEMVRFRTISSIHDDDPCPVCGRADDVVTAAQDGWVSSRRMIAELVNAEE